MRAWPAIMIVAVAGCGKGDDAKRPPEAPPARPAQPPPATDGPAKPPPLQALPATGMVCQGSGVHLWTEDDRVTKLKAIKVVGGRDGNVYDVWEDVRSLTAPSTPAIAFPPGVTRADASITSAASFVLQTADNQLDIYRDGAWKRVTMPHEDLFWARNAIEVDRQWWFVGNDGLFRLTDAGAVEPVGTPPGSVRGVLPVGKDLWVVTTPKEGGDYVVAFSKRDAKGQFKEVARVKAFTANQSRVAVGADRAAIFLEVGMRTGLVFLIDGGGKPLQVNQEDDPVEGIGSFDGAGRLWYRTKSALVARDADGTLTKYLLSSKAMFRSSITETMCIPIGAGFQRLPRPGTALTGTLEVHVEGGANADFVACESRHVVGATPCSNAPSRVTGTLDTTGRWKGEVPVGNYTYAVKRGSRWLQPDYVNPSKASCVVTQGERCELTARMP